MVTDETLPNDESADDDEAVPELVAASTAPVPLGKPIAISVDTRTKRAVAAEPKAKRRRGARGRTYLTLENVTATSLGAGRYVVYVNLPDGAVPSEHRHLRAGRISTFGLPEESLSDEEHSGSGSTYSFDVTDIVRRLEKEDRWDPSNVRVTIVPKRVEGVEGDEGDVHIGRIGLYVE